MEKFYSSMAKNLFWGMFAGIVEKSCQIHFVSALGISGKTDGFDERFVLAFGVEKGAMDTAEVDKIERGATEDEKGLKSYFSGIHAKSTILPPRASIVNWQIPRKSPSTAALYASISGR